MLSSLDPPSGGLSLKGELLSGATRCESVSIPVAAYLADVSEARIYRAIQNGWVPLAQPEGTRKRIALRSLAALGVDVSPQAVAAAQELFIRDYHQHNVTAWATRRPRRASQPTGGDSHEQLAASSL
jgi:hypothetical protein